MPHIIAEYSANLEDTLDIQALVDALHQTVIDTGIAEISAIRTRAARREFYRITDGAQGNAFLHIIARLRIGRTQEQKQMLANALMATADRMLAKSGQTLSIMLAVEMHDIDQLTVRKNIARARTSAA